MGMHRYYQQVTPERLEELLTDPAQVVEELFPSDRDYDPKCTIEKTWNALDFMLRILRQRGVLPDDCPFFEGGVEIGPSLDYGPALYWVPSMVADIASSFRAIDGESLQQAYLPELMVENDVYPGVWDREDEHEWNMDWIGQHFAAMVDYFDDASKRGNGMLEYLA